MFEVVQFFQDAATIREAIDPQTATVAVGVTAIAAHMYFMTVVRKLIGPGAKLDRFYDGLNLPIGFLVGLLIMPPAPIDDPQAWQAYGAFSVGLAVFASILANKVIDAAGKHEVRKEVEFVKSLKENAEAERREVTVKRPAGSTLP